MKKCLCWSLFAGVLSVILVPIWAQSPRQAKPPEETRPTNNDAIETCAIWPMEQISSSEWVYYAETVPLDSEGRCTAQYEPAYLQGLYSWPEECGPNNPECEGSVADASRRRPFPGLPNPVPPGHRPDEHSGIGMPFVADFQRVGVTERIRFEGRNRTFVLFRMELKRPQDKVLRLAQEVMGAPGNVPVDLAKFKAIDERGREIGDAASEDRLSFAYRATIDGEKYLVLLAR